MKRQKLRGLLEMAYKKGWETAIDHTSDTLIDTFKEYFEYMDSDIDELLEECEIE